MKSNKNIILFSILVCFVFFNLFSGFIYDFNSSLRTFLKDGKYSRTEFSFDGLPIKYSPRIGLYRSPFYVVHYGLQYSEVFRPKVKKTNSYHWLPDHTMQFWPKSPLEPSLELFKRSADWVVENVQEDGRGNVHLMYRFDWPYPNYPNGWLKSPWWSGLTDGHAITLMLRAWDCFSDERYLDVAQKLYESTLRPVSEGGSLVFLNGLPWIEEYVDPSADETKMSKVLNGMVYAYFGIKGFEEFYGIDGYAKLLEESILSNIDVFRLGNWSYYDAIESRSNIKYHNVNLALLEDDRLRSDKFEDVIRKWRVGRKLSAIMFLIYGPKTYAYYHFLISYFFAVFLLYYILTKIRRFLNVSK